MAWHLTAPHATIHVNLSGDAQARLGVRASPLLVALAWNDAAREEDVGGRRGPASLRYLVFGHGMLQPDWLEADEVAGMTPAWSP